VSRLSIHCPTAIPGQQAYQYARMMFEFKIHNPNNVAVILEKFEYAVYGDGHAVAGVETMVWGEHLDRTIAPFGTTNPKFPPVLATPRSCGPVMILATWGLPQAGQRPVVGEVSAW
jgi:hypothetical protein